MNFNKLKRVKDQLLGRMIKKNRRNLVEQAVVRVYFYAKRIVLYGRQESRNSAFYESPSSRIRYVSLGQLAHWSAEFAACVGNNHDVIVGVPRSGMLVASILSAKLGKPLSSPDSISRGESWVSKAIPSTKVFNRILLVDDSVTSGAALEEARQIIVSKYPSARIQTAALIATEASKKMVDYHHILIPHPRVFEWNLMHAKKGTLASDLDGVLCENCPPGYDANEQKYLNWIGLAKPLHIPAFRVDYIVSNRLEIYREETEAWLARNKVQYNRLILWNLSSKSDRKGNQAKNKIAVIARIKPDFFWESSVYEAEAIFEALKIPVFCFDEMRLYS